MSAAFVGAVGDDAAGATARRELRRARVADHVSVVPGMATGACIVLVEAGGERTMIPDAGANGALDALQLPVREIRDARHLHVSGYALFNPGARAAALAALELAATSGIGISVDAASAAPLAAIGPDRFASWLPPSTVLFANLDEARVLAGRSTPTECADVLTGMAAEIVVKCSDGAAIWASGRERASLAPEPVEVVDSTGAGDAFAAGFLAARLAGAQPGACLARAHTLAARALNRLGARP